jgi:RNA-directed DNA polymerase
MSDILLSELDCELERWCHRFVLYDDDTNFMCAVVALANECWQELRSLNQRLKLTLNRDRSRVARPWVCDYLGYGMSSHKSPKLKVALVSLSRLRDRLRKLLRGARGHKMANVIERINRCYVVRRVTSSSARASGLLRS